MNRARITPERCNPVHGPCTGLSTLRAALALSTVLGWASAQAQIGGGAPTRIVDLVELTDHDDQADIAVQFNCSVRYITHQPAAEGKELRIQLKPQGDCGMSLAAQTIGELPPLSGGANIINNVRVDSDVPGQLTLAFSFRKPEHFVVAQGADLRGMRLRLIDRARGRGKITVNEPSGPATSFAVNLESQPADYTPEALQLARDRLKVPVFVSQAVVDGVTWFRLRAGPFEKRADAERILARGLADYPRAWLAIGDDAVTTSGAGEKLPAVEPIGADPPLPAADLAALVGQARAAMNSRDYSKAVELLTKLQRQPEFPQRAQMQELLGLARERSGQLAHAKAEFEEYLRRYPTGEAADRVARRLATLRAASTAARTGQEGAPRAPRFGASRAGLARPTVTTAHVSTIPSPWARPVPAPRLPHSPRVRIRSTTTSTCWRGGADSALICSRVPASPMPRTSPVPRPPVPTMLPRASALPRSK